MFTLIKKAPWQLTESYVNAARWKATKHVLHRRTLGWSKLYKIRKGLPFRMHSVEHGQRREGALKIIINYKWLISVSGSVHNLFTCIPHPELYFPGFLTRRQHGRHPDCWLGEGAYNNTTHTHSSLSTQSWFAKPYFSPCVCCCKDRPLVLFWIFWTSNLFLCFLVARFSLSAWPPDTCFLFFIVPLSDIWANTSRDFHGTRRIWWRCWTRCPASYVIGMKPDRK